MKLYIKNKFVSLGGSSKVFNEDKEPKYIVKGKLFTITKKKLIKNLDGNTLYMVRNKWWRFLTKSAYIYDNNHNKLLKISRKISFADSYSISGFKDQYRIDGEIFSWNYTIIKNEQVIGTIKRRLDLLVDCFELSFENENDAPLLISFVIALDNIKDRK